MQAGAALASKPRLSVHDFVSQLGEKRKTKSGMETLGSRLGLYYKYVL